MMVNHYWGHTTGLCHLYEYPDRASKLIATVMPGARLVVIDEMVPVGWVMCGWNGGTCYAEVGTVEEANA